MTFFKKFWSTAWVFADWQLEKRISRQREISRFWFSDSPAYSPKGLWSMYRFLKTLANSMKSMEP